MVFMEKQVMNYWTLGITFFSQSSAVSKWQIPELQWPGPTVPMKPQGFSCVFLVGSMEFRWPRNLEDLDGKSQWDLKFLHLVHEPGFLQHPPGSKWARGEECNSHWFHFGSHRPSFGASSVHRQPILDSHPSRSTSAPHTSGSRLEKPWVYSWGFDFLLWWFVVPSGLSASWSYNGAPFFQKTIYRLIIYHSNRFDSLHRHRTAYDNTYFMPCHAASTQQQVWLTDWQCKLCPTTAHRARPHEAASCQCSTEVQVGYTLPRQGHTGVSSNASLLAHLNPNISEL